jgi:hypothetical protein
MKGLLKSVAALCVMSLLAACATTIGKDYDQSKVGQFVPGQTTIQQVISTLGEPQERETESDGQVRLHYQHIVSKSSIGSYIPGVSLVDHGTSTQDKDSYIYFDRQGKFLRSENTQSTM